MGVFDGRWFRSLEFFSSGKTAKERNFKKHLEKKATMRKIFVWVQTLGWDMVFGQRRRRGVLRGSNISSFRPFGAFWDIRNGRGEGILFRLTNVYI